MTQKTIYLAGGCFWGCQKYFDLIPGVLETEVGYAKTAPRQTPPMRRSSITPATPRRCG